MTTTPRSFASFDAALAVAFAREVFGETFLAALSRTEPDPRRSALWAKVALIENRTVTAQRPLAEAMDLTPGDAAAVRHQGHAEATEWQALPCIDLMALMVRDHPAGYLEEFPAMLAIAPADAKGAIRLLIDHKVAIIDMARAELAGSPDPAAPLDACLAQVAGWTAGGALAP